METTPKLEHKSFNCMYCGVFSNQTWHTVFFLLEGKYNNPGNYHACRCSHCFKVSYWSGDGAMLFPRTTLAPKPHNDLPKSALTDYQEARAVYNDSFRSCIFLLKISLSKLLKELGESGNDIEADLSSLVSKGLHPEVCQAYINLATSATNLEIVNKLFELVNFIVEDQITKKKQISSFFSIN
ncbi:hypothetical protein [Paenibacillus agaridevorans]|uniref:hypothetical protein n=1 Tax=Paenibacillus agaridevorans TaxID=171404 RepID=UPI001BE4A8B5|nr:hypothetical protein [Paenibacillus agaridevorans]